MDEGNSTIIQIVLDHAAGSNFSVNIEITSPSMLITGDRLFYGAHNKLENIYILNHNNFQVMITLCLKL